MTCPVGPRFACLERTSLAKGGRNPEVIAATVDGMARRCYQGLDRLARNTENAFTRGPDLVTLSLRQ